jgi:glycosyltransferase involved in cell wall biosynthesis
MNLSVIICAHNPRADYLRRVLDALNAQALRKEQWELLLIDNASTEPLSRVWDLSWHPQARHLRENEPGLTPARLRGIQESKGALLVFVDDDNVLESDYLTLAAEMADDWPMLGAWAGEALPEFEIEPAAELSPYINMMASSPDDGKFGKDIWSNIRGTAATPSGTGMCVRRAVATEYFKLATQDENRRRLDRCGQSLVSGGDTDMAFTACELGLGTGFFHKLKLTHLIPSHRVTLNYLLRLKEAMSYSAVIVDSFRNPYAGQVSARRWLIDSLRAWTSRGIQRKFNLATLRGQSAARGALRRQVIR